MRRLGYPLTVLVAIMFCAAAGFAQDGKLKIKAIPKHAYVFVDGKAIRDGSETISLSPGRHVVVVLNYGYKISTQDVCPPQKLRLVTKKSLNSFGVTREILC